MKNFLRFLIAATLLFAAAPSFADTNTLTWIDSSGNDPNVNDQEEGFKIYRSINGEPFAVLPNAVGANVTTFTENIAATNADQQVCYRVTAFNTAGESPPSNQACKMIARLPWVIPAQPTQASVK